MNPQDTSARSPWRVGSLLLLIAAVLACLSVLLINRGPLYYFDTGSYFKQGDTALSLILPAPPPEGEAATDSQSGTGGSEAAAKDKTTSGSRSMVYAAAGRRALACRCDQWCRADKSGGPVADGLAG